MSGHREYTVDASAILQGIGLGLEENTAQRIAKMARRSAVVTHPDGNRRFAEFILNIDRNVVTSVKIIPRKVRNNEHAD